MLIEADKALTELKKRHAETKRQISLEQRQQVPNTFRLRTLESQQQKWYTKIARIQELQREVKDLESTLSMKMMNRYPENRPFRSEFKRDLHRTRRILLDIAMQYQPKPKPKLPTYPFK